MVERGVGELQHFHAIEVIGHVPAIDHHLDAIPFPHRLLDILRPAKSQRILPIAIPAKPVEMTLARGELPRVALGIPIGVARQRSHHRGRRPLLFAVGTKTGHQNDIARPTFDDFVLD